MAERESNQQLFSRSAIVLAVTGAGIVADIVKDMAIARWFGATALADAFFVAYSVPLLVASALVSSSRAALVPLFTTLQVLKGPCAVWHVAAPLIAASTAVSLAVVAAGIAVSPRLVRLTAAGLSPDMQWMVAHLGQIMLPALIPTAVVVVLGAALLAVGSYTVPSAGNLVRALGMLLVLVLLMGRCGVKAAAVGFLVGTLSQFALMVWSSWRLGFRFSGDVWGQRQGVRAAAALVAWPLGGALLLQNSRVVERALATFLKVGSVAAVSYAHRIVFSLNSVLGTSVLLVLLPSMSAYAAEQDQVRLVQQTTLGLKMLSMLVLPLSVTLLVLNRPLVRMLFERGAFDQTATSLTSTALFWYSLGLLWISLIPVFNSAFYAMKRVRVPVYNDLVLVATNIVLDLSLLRPLGLGGLAIGYSLAGLVALARIIWLFRRYVGPIGGENLTSFASRLLAAGGAMGAGMWLIYRVLQQFGRSGALLEQVVALGMALLAGISLFYGSLLVLQTPELLAIWRLAREALSRQFIAGGESGEA